MHVGLNMLHLVPRETGGSELYARRLVPALLEAHNDLRLTIFAGHEATPSLAGEPWARDLELVHVPVSSRSRARRVLAEQTLLPAATRRRRVDLLHNVFTTAPAMPGVPQVTTILDVIYKLYPETHAGLLARGMAVLVPLAARRSRRVLTISEASKRDLVRLLGVDEQKIDVTPLGPGLPDDVLPVSPDELRRRFDVGEAPLVLTASAKRPHKNLERLFDAIGRLESSPVLVVPGYATPFEQALRERARGSGAADRIRFAGWVDDATLDGLYRAADCFVFPSLAEGFGLPVLEAMARGTPVACSNASSLPEVAGDAAVYFDPTSVDDIARAITQVLNGVGVSDRLRREGPARARRFSWEATAAGTLTSYERALAGSSQASAGQSPPR
jgi:glycosyltransferase involved in cell wall biosynthesis